MNSGAAPQIATHSDAANADVPAYTAVANGGQSDR
jgi:hypothetical protein